MTQLLVLVLGGTYAVGAWKLWTGFNRTNFDDNLGNRIILSALWPVLLANSSYRRNFQKALKGQ